MIRAGATNSPCLKLLRFLLNSTIRVRRRIVSCTMTLLGIESVQLTTIAALHRSSPLYHMDPYSQRYFCQRGTSIAFRFTRPAARSGL